MSSDTSHVESQAGVSSETFHEEELRRQGLLLSTQQIDLHEGSWPSSPPPRHTAAKSSPAKRPPSAAVAETQEVAEQELEALGRGSGDLAVLGSPRLGPEVPGLQAVKRQRTTEGSQQSQESQLLKVEYNSDARVVVRYLMDRSTEERQTARDERRRADDERRCADEEREKRHQAEMAQARTEARAEALVAQARAEAKAEALLEAFRELQGRKQQEPVQVPTVVAGVEVPEALGVQSPSTVQERQSAAPTPRRPHTVKQEHACSPFIFVGGGSYPGLTGLLQHL